MSDIVERLLTTRDCTVCDGDGTKSNGRICGGCDGAGKVLRYDSVGKEAADEIERLRAGIKRLSEEEELCAETTGDDPFSMVYLAAKLAAVESALATAEAALAQQPLSVQEGWRQALDRPFCVLFLDGRNEHGSHVLASYPRSFDTAETNIEDEAETILAEAEALGFSIGDHVWAEFDWIAPQIDNEGRTELTGYWEFKRIDPNMSRVVAPTVGGKG